MSDATRRWLSARRDLREPPGSEVADYEEYTHLYYESWLDPEIRWLLSTVPSCMIFDDHDVIDDWNTSAAWVADMRGTPWWRERLLSGLMSYWVHQHLGNLSPAELAADPLYSAVRSVPDGTDELRAFASRADVDPASVRWSYRRDFGRVRLLMVDSRAARVLEERHRSMLDPGEADWLRTEALTDRASYDHLLIGTSLPWLLPHLVHDAEAWDAALSRGERGARWAGFGEKLRRAADLEHWAAFPESFEQLADLIAEVGTGTRLRRRCSCCRETCITRMWRSPSGVTVRGLQVRPPSGLAGPPTHLLSGPQLHTLLHARRLPLRLERGRARTGPPPGPARPLPGPVGDVAQNGRALVRQPAHDPHAARTLGPAAAGAGTAGRDAADRGGLPLTSS